MFISKNLSWYSGIIVALIISVSPVRASEPSAVKYEIQIIPERENYNYEVGDTVRFQVRILPIENVSETLNVKIDLGLEKVRPISTQQVDVPPEGIEIDGGTLKEPGFLRLTASTEIDGKKIKSFAAVAFSKEKIEPTQTNPEDFDAFWAGSKAKLADIPMDPELIPLSQLSKKGYDAYQLSLANFDPEGKKPRFYGILTVPKGDGPFPAVLQTPGAGVRGFLRGGGLPLPRDKAITLAVGVHGLSVIEPPEFYKEQAQGPLRNYLNRNLDDREMFYYRRVILGCQRALEYLASHSKWDGKHLVARGVSQGGGLAIISAALEPRVTGLVVESPVFCDLTGFVDGRAGGWPGRFRQAPKRGDEARKVREKEIEVSAYYDAVNFAKRLKIPSHFTQGYVDGACPPTGFFAMYNSITSPKEVNLLPTAGHTLPRDSWAPYQEHTAEFLGE